MLKGGCYLKDPADLVSRFILGKIRVTIWVIGVINLLTKFSDPPGSIQEPSSS